MGLIYNFYIDIFCQKKVSVLKDVILTKTNLIHKEEQIEKKIEQSVENNPHSKLTFRYRSLYETKVNTFINYFKSDDSKEFHNDWDVIFHSRGIKCNDVLFRYVFEELKNEGYIVTGTSPKNVKLTEKGLNFFYNNHSFLENYKSDRYARWALQFSFLAVVISFFSLLIQNIDWIIRQLN